MPIYMDFHDLPDGVTAEHVAQMHQADLKIEHKFNCRGLTYWCDEIRQTAFCLIEAPNEQAIKDLHEKAHGGVPQRIIEVNDSIVETFLGRIRDPERAQENGLHIIDDSAYRVLLVLNMHCTRLREDNQSTLKAALRGYSQSFKSIINRKQGRLVRHEEFGLLASFTLAQNAIACANDIKELHNAVITPELEFRIGICAGDPVTEKDQLFEETIGQAKNLSRIDGQQIVVSETVRQLYEQECDQTLPKDIRTLSTIDEQFLDQVLEYVNAIWEQPQVEAGDMHKKLGYSKSKLYRMLTSIAGLSPLQLLKRYRLEQGLKLLDTQSFQISEVAYQCGFSNPAYFSKCFQENYGVLPSVYLKSLEEDSSR